MGDPFEPPPGNYYVPLVDGASNSAASPSNREDLSAKDVRLYSLLGLFFVTALATGTLLYDNHPFLGGLAALIGAVGLIVTVVLLIRYRPKTIHALIVTTASLIATWAFLAYVIWTKPKEVIVHDPPTAEDVEKATAPMRADRDAQRQRADGATQQLVTYQAQLSTLQSNLASATNERDNLRRSLEETTSLLNAARAQLVH
jgi:hypothetical protein